MDGVLIDSTPAVARVWRNWAVEHGFDPAEVVGRAHGRPSLTTIREYLPNANHLAENRKWSAAKSRTPRVSCFFRARASCSPVCRRAVDDCHLVYEGASGGSPARRRAAHPRGWITSSDVTNGKPHPEPFLKAAANLGFAAQDCIVLEDAPAGIRAGKASGARVIAFRTTVPETELHIAGSDWIVNSCAEIELVEVVPSDSSPGLTLLVHEGIR